MKITFDQQNKNKLKKGNNFTYKGLFYIHIKYKS